MQIIGKGDETYILLSRIVVSENIRLSDYVELQPADTSNLDFSTAISTCSRPDDIAVVAALSHALHRNSVLLLPPLKSYLLMRGIGHGMLFFLVHYFILKLVSTYNQMCQQRK